MLHFITEMFILMTINYLRLKMKTLNYSSVVLKDQVKNTAEYFSI